MIRSVVTALTLAVLALPAFAQQKLSVGYIATADSLPIVVAKEPPKPGDRKECRGDDPELTGRKPAAISSN